MNKFYELIHMFLSLLAVAIIGLVFGLVIFFGYSLWLAVLPTPFGPALAFIIMLVTVLELMYSMFKQATK